MPTITKEHVLNASRLLLATAFISNCQPSNETSSRQTARTAGGESLKLLVDVLQGGINILPPGQRSLTYCVADGFVDKAEIIAAMKQATDDWAFLKESGVTFTHLPEADPSCATGLPGSGALSNVTFRLVSAGADASPHFEARAFRPDYPPIERNITLNDQKLRTESCDDKGTTALRGTLAHELGHILGFRHEDELLDNGNASGGNDKVRAFCALNVHDPESVMSYSHKPCYKLSALDIEKARAVYSGQACSPDSTEKSGSNGVPPASPDDGIPEGAQPKVSAGAQPNVQEGAQPKAQEGAESTDPDMNPAKKAPLTP